MVHRYVQYNDYVHDMVHRYVQYNDYVLAIRVSFMVNVCVCEGFRSNGFVTNDAAIFNGWSL
jgi:hypothetical protein